MSKETEHHNHDLTISTLSILMLVIITAAIVMLMIKNGTTAHQQDASVMADAQLMSLPDASPTPEATPFASADSASETVPATPQTPEKERMAEITARFEQAVVMLHAKEYEHAATALHRVMVLAPRMPEVYVNMGYAKLGQELPQEALLFFEAATQLKPEQANAYWGMAVALENSGDLAGALGAMRTFIHLSPGDAGFLRRARSALWEWEETLARGPLPEEEREFLERGALQWESRNTPRDDVDSGEQELNIQPIQ